MEELELILVGPNIPPELHLQKLDSLSQIFPPEIEEGGQEEAEAPPSDEELGMPRPYR